MGRSWKCTPEVKFALAGTNSGSVRATEKSRICERAQCRRGELSSSVWLAKLGVAEEMKCEDFADGKFKLTGPDVNLLSEGDKLKYRAAGKSDLGPYTVLKIEMIDSDGIAYITLKEDCNAISFSGVPEWAEIKGASRCRFTGQLIVTNSEPSVLFCVLSAWFRCGLTISHVRYRGTPL